MHSRTAYRFSPGFSASGVDTTLGTFDITGNTASLQSDSLTTGSSPNPVGFRGSSNLAGSQTVLVGLQPVTKNTTGRRGVINSDTVGNAVSNNGVGLRGAVSNASLLGGAGDSAGTTATAAGPIPSTLTVYNLAVTGVTYEGDTNFLSSQTTFTPSQQFALPGFLVVNPNIFPSNFSGDTSNGSNPREIGLLVGGGILNSASPPAGAAQFGTNTVLARLWGGNFSQDAALDVAFVNADAAAGTISLQVDTRVARLSQLNSFLKSSGLLANPQQVLAGNMNLSFSSDGRTVTGNVTFYGSGYVYPGSSAYTATFSGSVSQ